MLLVLKILLVNLRPVSLRNALLVIITQLEYNVITLLVRMIPIVCLRIV